MTYSRTETNEASNTFPWPARKGTKRLVLAASPPPASHRSGRALLYTRYTERERDISRHTPNVQRERDAEKNRLFTSFFSYCLETSRPRLCSKSRVIIRRKKSKSLLQHIVQYEHTVLSCLPGKLPLLFPRCLHGSRPRSGLVSPLMES